MLVYLSDTTFWTQIQPKQVTGHHPTCSHLQGFMVLQTEDNSYFPSNNIIIFILIKVLNREKKWGKAKNFNGCTLLAPSMWLMICAKLRGVKGFNLYPNVLCSFTLLSFFLQHIISWISLSHPIYWEIFLKYNKNILNTKNLSVGWSSVVWSVPNSLADF